MPAPQSYDEATLATYLVDTLADVATALGWSEATPQIVRAITATERACAVADIATATDMRQVEAVAAREAWRAAMAAAAAQFDTSVPGGPNAKFSQLYTQCRDAFLAAVTDAALYDANNVIGAASVTYAPDVYGPLNTNGEFGW